MGKYGNMYNAFRCDFKFQWYKCRKNRHYFDMSLAYVYRHRLKCAYEVHETYDEKKHIVNISIYSVYIFATFHLKMMRFALTNITTTTNLMKKYLFYFQRFFQNNYEHKAN